MLPVRPQRELPCNSVGGSGIRQGLVIPALPANHSQPLVASALALSRCDRNSYILTTLLLPPPSRSLSAHHITTITFSRRQSLPPPPSHSLSAHHCHQHRHVLSRTIAAAAACI